MAHDRLNGRGRTKFMSIHDGIKKRKLIEILGDGYYRIRVTLPVLEKLLKTPSLTFSSHLNSQI